MYQLSDYVSNNIKITLDVLNKYDPIGIATTVNESEYEMEAIDIGNRAGIITIECLTRYIGEVFLFWFDEAPKAEICLHMALEINERIRSEKYDG